MNDTMTSTASRPSADSGYRDGGNNGNNSGSDGSKSSVGYAVAALSMTRPALPAFVYPVNGVLKAVINMNTAFINNQLINLGSYINKAKPLAARMATLGASRRSPVAGFALLAADFEARRKETALRLEKEAIARARREAKNVGINDIYQVVALPLATVFATSVAMDKIKAKISEKSMVVTDVVAQPVINVKTQQRQMAITKNWEGVPVVKAKKTYHRNIYSAPVVAGMKPMQISINHDESFNSGWSFQKDQPKLNLESTVEIFSSAVVSDTHHAIIDFDGEHDSIYISVSKTPTANEEIKQLVEAEKVEQEWLAAHPLLAAELELSKAQEQFAEIDKSYQEKQNYLNQLLSSREGLTLSDPVKNPYLYQKNEEYYSYIKKFNLKDLDLKIDDNDFIDALKNGLRTVDMEFLQKYTKGYKGSQLAIIFIAYSSAMVSLINAYEKIEKTKTELAPIMESRKKAEDKKKEAEEKVEKESKRDKPGTVTGDGQEVGDNWLTGVGEGDGDPIPKSVADELKGKEFSSFDKLRKAIWTSIGKKQKLTQNIKSKSNKKQVSKGKSPFAFKKDRVGGRKRLEMHHVEEIQHGGPVYNLDNLRIMTPKNHIRIHSKK